MTTAREVIYRALKLLSVTMRGATPSAAESSDGLNTLNSMLDSFASYGYDYTHTTLTLDDDVVIQNAAATLTASQRAGLVQHVTALLTVELAPEYGKDPNPSLVARIESAIKAVNLLLINHETVEVDLGFQWLPSRSYGTGRLL